MRKLLSGPATFGLIPTYNAGFYRPMLEKLRKNSVEDVELVLELEAQLELLLTYNVVLTKRSYCLSDDNLSEFISLQSRTKSYRGV